MQSKSDLCGFTSGDEGTPSTQDKKSRRGRPRHSLRVTIQGQLPMCPAVVTLLAKEFQKWSV
jgi:hypothetical protein